MATTAWLLVHAADAILLNPYQAIWAAFEASTAQRLLRNAICTTICVIPSAFFVSFVNFSMSGMVSSFFFSASVLATFSSSRCPALLLRGCQGLRRVIVSRQQQVRRAMVPGVIYDNRDFGAG